jgi:hypothetical protein
VFFSSGLQIKGILKTKNCNNINNASKEVHFDKEAHIKSDQGNPLTDLDRQQGIACKSF